MLNRTLQLILAAFLLVGCGSEKKEIDSSQRQHVHDNAFVLGKDNADKLDLFLDSLNALYASDFQFCSIGNYYLENDNTDSLAELYYRKLDINRKGGLIFISKSTREFKILTGPDIPLTETQLDSLTIGTLDYFKRKDFINGLRSAYSVLAESLND